jgi:hypothetical protein
MDRTCHPERSEGSPRRRLFAAVIALSTLLAGCPESIHPISDAAQAAPDPALYGVWHGRFDGDEIYLHVGPAERGMTRAVMVEHKGKDGAIKIERYVAFPTQLGKLAMLNVKAVDDPDRDRGYTLFRYQAEKKKLTLWMTAYGAVREDIKAGRLAGKAEDKPYGDTVITASGEQLGKYLQESDPKRLFDKPLVFRRIAER